MSFFLSLIRRYDLWITFLLFLVMIPAERGEWFALMEEQTLSMRQILRISEGAPNQVRFPTDTIMLVNTDEQFFAEYGSYPLRRTDIGDIAERLSVMGAKVVAVDVLMDFPSSYREDPDTAAALQRAGNVLLVSQADLHHGDFRKLNYPAEPMRSVTRSGYTNITSSSSIITTLSRLTIHPEITTETDGWPFAVQALSMYLNETPRIEKGTPDTKGPILHFGDKLSVPLDHNYHLYIDFPKLTDGARFLSQLPFASMSAIEILELDEDELEEMRTVFEDKIVLVGDTSEVSHDWFDTPVGMVYGVEVIADTIHTLLKGGGLIPATALIENSVSFGFMAVLLLLSFLKHPLTRNLLNLMLFIGWLAAISWLYVEQGLIISVSYTLVAGTLSFMMINLHHYLQERTQKGVIKDAFGHYLSPKVVEALVKDPNKLSLGGENREMTAFFSDVAKFSTISEQLTPSELVALLNEYLTEMCNIIATTEGTVDKFEGDAIIAFWGAPLKMEDHAVRACLSAIDQQKLLIDFRERLLKESSLPVPFTVRIGLNTGSMIVGNMGSAQRMDYTIMGDSVNLAARLEGANKFYGSDTMISEFTYRQAEKFIDARELDTIRVVGKSEPVTVYQLLDRKGAVTGRLADLTDLYHQGLEHYKRMDFQHALKQFQAALACIEDDGPSRTYVKRCQEFIHHPPPDSWDGVFRLTAKG